jgi:hypothetical protein
VGGERRRVVSITCPPTNGPERSSADVRDRACWDHPQRVEAHLSVAAMTYPDVSNLPVFGGFLLFAGLFVLRELVSGALKEAGKDVWRWAKARRTSRRCPRGTGPDAY